MMKTKTLMALCLVTVLTAVAATANAQSTEPTRDASDPQQLAIGDWYDFTIERPEFKQPDGDGVLIKVTDDWVVIGKVLSEANDVRTGVPVLRDLPVVGKWFGKTTRGRVLNKVYAWIPRDGFRIDKHQTITNQRFKDEWANDAPVLESECDVHFIEQGNRALDGGEYLGVSDGQIRFARPTYETNLVPDPKWGSVPIIGDMLAKQEIIERKVEKQIPLTDILFVLTSRPLTQEETKLVTSN